MSLSLTLDLVTKDDVPVGLDISVKDTPGLVTTLPIEIVQQVHQALDVLLGPHAAPDLAMLVREMFEVHDRPCEPDGCWHHVEEYAALEAQVRKLVGAPPKPTSRARSTS